MNGLENFISGIFGWNKPGIVPTKSDEQNASELTIAADQALRAGDRDRYQQAINLRNQFVPPAEAAAASPEAAAPEASGDSPGLLDLGRFLLGRRQELIDALDQE